MIRNYSILRIVLMTVVLIITGVGVFSDQGITVLTFIICFGSALLIPALYKWIHTKIVRKKASAKE